MFALALVAAAALAQCAAASDRLALDARGCVLIATGDTRLTDPTTGGPLPTARPLYLHQNGGPSLLGPGTCS